MEYVNNKIPVMVGGGAKSDVIVYSIMFVLIIFILYKSSKTHDILMDKMKLQNQNIELVLKNYNDQKNHNKITVNLKDEKQHKHPMQYLREYDYRTLNDPLVAPKRRDDYNTPVLPLPTRGYPPPYKKMGLLVDNNANDKYKILFLMGRQKHPNSTVYDYYAVDSDNHGMVKFNINKTRELQEDDTIQIKELDRTYKVSLDKTLGFDYDPYLY